MGALSTAFIAYGTAFVFGTTGSTAYDSVRAAFSATPGIEFTEGLGVAFVLAALAFKVAAAPGHMWAPDVYQGAPLPVTAFLATASKCAAFAALVRLCLDAFLPLQAQWGPALLVVAALTVVWGSFGAIRQTDLRRLLGYSSITHSGYLLFATVSGGAQAASAILFYLIQYVFSTLACFLVLGILARRGGDYSLEALKGLNRRSPWLSWMTAVALLSLTGIPPFSGFIAKYLVLASVPNYAEFASLYFVALGLVLIAVVVSVVYYFGIIRTMWLDSGVDAGVNEERIERDATLVAPLVACVAFVVLLGAYPSLALTPANDAAKSLGLETQRQPGTLAVQHTKSHMLLRPKINHTP
jgi:NADH-quinone oxidoreductase subunit N